MRLGDIINIQKIFDRFRSEKPEEKNKVISKKKQRRNSKSENTHKSLKDRIVDYSDESYERARGYIERLSPVIEEANRRWEQITSASLQSNAIARAQMEGGRDYFSFEGKVTPEDVIAEATRARVFLHDPTSTYLGAKRYTSELESSMYKGQFGNQFNTWENKFKHYNTKEFEHEGIKYSIDDDYARMAFAAYRDLESIEAARVIAYGSENMIVAIYDITTKMGLINKDNQDDRMEIVHAGLQLLDEEAQYKSEEFAKAFENANSVSGLVNIIEEEEKRYAGKWI